MYNGASAAAETLPPASAIGDGLSTLGSTLYSGIATAGEATYNGACAAAETIEWKDSAPQPVQ